LDSPGTAAGTAEPVSGARTFGLLILWFGDPKVRESARQAPRIGRGSQVRVTLATNEAIE